MSALVFLCCILGFVSSSSAENVNLILPGQIQASVSLNHTAVGPLHVYSDESVFDGVEGALWISSMVPQLEKALIAYRKILLTAMAPAGCQSLSSVLKSFTAIFLATLLPLKDGGAPFADVAERRGYFHPANPGPIVQVVPWDDEAVRGLLLHEAFHQWCFVSPKTEIERWVGEGAADMLSYIVLGQVPQRNISRYFSQAAGASLYGGSFLWWLALFESRRTKTSHLKALAMLHLGLRQDLVFGVLAPRGGRAKNPMYPFGEISVTQSNESGVTSIPYWRRPWGTIELERPMPGEKPEGFFTWHGPISDDT